METKAGRLDIFRRHGLILIRTLAQGQQLQTILTVADIKCTRLALVAFAPNHHPLPSPQTQSHNLPELFQQKMKHRSVFDVGLAVAACLTSARAAKFTLAQNYSGNSL